MIPDSARMGKVKSRFFKYWSMVFENIITSSMYTFEDFAALYSGPWLTYKIDGFLHITFNAYLLSCSPKKTEIQAHGVS